MRVTSTWTRSATASTRCSQLSRISSAGAVPIWSTMRLSRSVRRAPPVSLPVDRLAHAEHVADLDRHALGRGDAGELDEVDDRLLGEPAHQVGQPGLAQPARADDRGDPGGADRLGERGDVLVAADQAGRLVEQSLAHRAVAGEQLGVQRLELGRGIDAEPVGEPLADALVALERGRHAAHGRLAAQQRRHVASASPPASRSGSASAWRPSADSARPSRSPGPSTSSARARSRQPAELALGVAPETASREERAAAAASAPGQSPPPLGGLRGVRGRARPARSVSVVPSR